MDESVDTNFIAAVVSAAVASPVVQLSLRRPSRCSRCQRKKGSKTIRRTRRTVEDIFREKGPREVRRSYRMSEGSFWLLFDMIVGRIPRPNKRRRGKTPNGDIKPELRLSIALRYYAGGDPHDIASCHGVSRTEVWRSIWITTDAINTTPELRIEYPLNGKLRKVFKEKSKVDIDCCAGAIDGMLIWTHKPSSAACEEAKVGEAKFFCGRKKKFGLSLQAVCDSDRRFLDYEISHPGSTSDYLAFTTSNLHHKLEGNSPIHKSADGTPGLPPIALHCAWLKVKDPWSVTKAGSLKTKKDFY